MEVRQFTQRQMQQNVQSLCHLGSAGVQPQLSRSVCPAFQVAGAASPVPPQVTPSPTASPVAPPPRMVVSSSVPPLTGSWHSGQMTARRGRHTVQARPPVQFAPQPVVWQRPQGTRSQEPASRSCSPALQPRSARAAAAVDGLRNASAVAEGIVRFRSSPFNSMSASCTGVSTVSQVETVSTSAKRLNSLGNRGLPSPRSGIITPLHSLTGTSSVPRAATVANLATVATLASMGSTGPTSSPPTQQKDLLSTSAPGTPSLAAPSPPAQGSVPVPVPVEVTVVTTSEVENSQPLGTPPMQTRFKSPPAQRQSLGRCAATLRLRPLTPAAAPVVPSIPAAPAATTPASITRSGSGSGSASSTSSRRASILAQGSMSASQCSAPAGGSLETAIAGGCNSPHGMETKSCDMNAWLMESIQSRLEASTTTSAGDVASSASPPMRSSPAEKPAPAPSPSVVEATPAAAPPRREDLERALVQLRQEAAIERAKSELEAQRRELEVQRFIEEKKRLEFELQKVTLMQETAALRDEVERRQAEARPEVPKPAKGGLVETSAAAAAEAAAGGPAPRTPSRSGQRHTFSPCYSSVGMSLSPLTDYTPSPCTTPQGRTTSVKSPNLSSIPCRFDLPRFNMDESDGGNRSGGIDNGDAAGGDSMAAAAPPLPMGGAKTVYPGFAGNGTVPLGNLGGLAAAPSFGGRHSAAAAAAVNLSRGGGSGVRGRVEAGAGAEVPEDPKLLSPREGHRPPPPPSVAQNVINGSSCSSPDIGHKSRGAGCGGGSGSYACGSSGGSRTLRPGTGGITAAERDDLRRRLI
eukprot:TRINITY_DN15267_c0_g1_i1.p1 TRINITY_DN15267_c0_g1~~TRINITY_DN15267_c0_g1_i1.p1  ORF type:complete len:807 (-),score=149.95 TRINITY_DN15267_c0_g1_i1:71-2491(-)